MTILQGDALEQLKTLDTDSIDAVCCDPPYGFSFMNKDWDKAVIGVETWKEVLRVLKPGSFAAIMSSPRQDVLSRMIVNLQDAGFRTDFTSIYWTYASGFPKAANVSKLVDKRNGLNRLDQGLAQYLRQKRLEKGYSLKDVDKWLNGKDIASHLESLCNSRNYLPRKHYYLILKEKLDLDNRFDELIEREEAEREIISREEQTFGIGGASKRHGQYKIIDKSATEKAKELDGSYAGWQPKPAVEIILLVMKPLSEKTYVDQALKNGHGCTWLDDCRIPYQSEDVLTSRHNQPRENTGYGIHQNEVILEPNSKGRFPANLLVSDDVLNDGKTRVSKQATFKKGSLKFGGIYNGGKDYHNTKDFVSGFDDRGSYSKYFDLDKWFDTTFPFIITPKPSPAEKNRGLDKWMTEPKKVNDGRKTEIDNPFQRGEPLRINTHPTTKPIKLMSWLITLLSRENDTVLDPFCGSGTTLIAAKMLNRKYIGIDLNEEYVKIANKRLESIL